MRNNPKRIFECFSKYSWESFVRDARSIRMKYGNNDNENIDLTLFPIDHVTQTETSSPETDVQSVNHIAQIQILTPDSTDESSQNIQHNMMNPIITPTELIPKRLPIQKNKKRATRKHSFSKTQITTKKQSQLQSDGVRYQSNMVTQRCTHKLKTFENAPTTSKYFIINVKWKRNSIQMIASNSLFI